MEPFRASPPASISLSRSAATSSPTGTISGEFGVWSYGEGGVDYIDNSGLIASQAAYIAIDLQGQASTPGVVNTVTNTGAIHGGLYAGATAAVEIDNTGSWLAQSIASGLEIVAAGSALTNAGVIDSWVKVYAADFTLVNSGSLTGAVTLGSVATKSAITNDNEIYGDVTLSVDSTLTNTGAIHGTVALGAGDKLYLGGGTITGAITASAGGGTITGAIAASSRGGDEFIYSGGWGHETIDRFIGGTGSTHDVIQFNADEFSSLAAVQAAMEQEGSDVLIKLDAADTIVLAGVKLSSLFRADFKFV